jgi:hypothetical protein
MAANLKGTAIKKTSSPGRRTSAVHLAAVAMANVTSTFNPRLRRRVDNTANKGAVLVVANIASRLNRRFRHRVANRADSRAAARVKIRERKAKLPQLHHRSN